MTRTRSVIDWDGRDDATVLRAIRALPPGRYVLVLENELGGDAADETLDLAPEQLVALDEALAQLARGETVSREEFEARPRATDGADRVAPGTTSVRPHRQE